MLHSKLFTGALALTLGPSLIYSATLTDVPMQGGMAMPMVAYHSLDGTMHVMMPMEVPQLTPLLRSNPADHFDPADPWFDELDPGRRGASFSRRYGFVMDSMSDPLPANTQMWIRKLSGPPELKFFRYASTAPKSFTPIFGTDGATNALHWNGMMFHPTVSAPPGTNAYTATFEAYLLDTLTGQEVSQSSSGNLTFTWTNVSDGRPELNLAPKIMVAWPAATTSNWSLESADTLSATTWIPVTNSPVTVEGQPCVILSIGAAQQYFRMRYQP